MHYHAWDMSQGWLGIKTKIVLSFSFFYMHTPHFLSKLLTNTYPSSQDLLSDIYMLLI